MKMSLDLKSLMYYNNASTGDLTMEFIKELTEPKTLSDGTIRMPNSTMKRAARVIEELLNVRKGLEQALHTANCNNLAVEEMARREIIKMEERLAEMASRVVKATADIQYLNEERLKFTDSLEDCVQWWKSRYHSAVEPLDLTEFHEINNRDRE